MDDSSWLQFEDDYFDKKEKKSAPVGVNYRPFMCRNKWFFNDDETETAKILQDQANYCYWTKDYDTAAILYRKALDNYFSNSPFMKRNLLESIARCYFRLRELAKAQALAEECLLLSYTVELRSSILNLLSTIYKSQGLLNLEKKALLQLISFHPQNYRIWLDLAHCFSNLSKSPGTEESLLPMMMEAACLLRVSLIITALKNEESLLTLLMIENKLSSMNLPENFIAAGKKFFGRDLMEEHLATIPEDLTKTDELESTEVNKKSADDEQVWFRWIYGFLK